MPPVTKKRVLFVEADPALLQVYVRLLDDEPGVWEVLGATDAAQALELLNQQPCDVVVSDLRMRGMSGVELMAAVRQRHPHISRIILSEISDQEEVSRCLNSIHQFLPKPFEVPALKAALARIGGLDAYLQDARLKALVGQLGSLPSLPSLYIEIMKELSSNEPSLDNIAEIIARDPGMTARMLQIVNSAVLGLARKISSPFEAVQYLGTATIRSLVLSAQIFSRFNKAPVKGFSFDRLWAHALGTAGLSRRIMQLEDADRRDAEEAYVAGMLHDVGKLMLATCIPRRFQDALTLAAARELPLCEAEMAIYGATHAGVAAYLFGLWGLPVPIVEAVALHHAPGRSSSRQFGPLTAVHVANILVHPEGKPATMDTEYLAACGVDSRVNAWRKALTS
ncbi:MAG: response regulator [Verrucomicrobiota bacterium]